MERVSMCRICLLKSVRLYVVANKNLQEIYQKLTDIPLKTDDRRPMSACSFCYVKLEQCYRLQRKCLEAEKLFAQILNEEYQHNQEQMELYGGFVITPVMNISMGDDGRIGSQDIKQEPICEEPCDAELKVEHLNDDLKSENFDAGYPALEDPTFYSEADSEDEPLVKIRYGVQEVQEAAVGTERAFVAKESKLNIRNVKQEVIVPVEREDNIPVKQRKSELSDENEKIVQKSTQCTESVPVPNPYINNYDTVRRNIQNIEVTNNLSKNESNLKIYKNAIETKKSLVELPYKCDICLRGFKTKKYLKRHLFIHTGKQPYKCDICKKSFTRKNYLISHIRLHTGEKPYKCDICQLSFASQSNFKYHCRRHTEIPPKRFECDICKKSFSQKQHLNIHLRLHTGEKPYKCDICERCFVSKSHLNQHNQTHTSIKPFKCDICQKSFVYKGQLKLHVWSHTTEKPHKCHTCERSFVAKSTLKIHIRTHTGEKPYRCDFCSRDFNCVKYLNKHVCKARPLPANSEKYTIKCDICHKSFSKIKDLVYHYSSEHPEEKPYKCNFCSRCYVSKGGLNKHIRITHK